MTSSFSKQLEVIQVLDLMSKIKIKPIVINASGQSLSLLDVSPGWGHKEHESGITGLYKVNLHKMQPLLLERGTFLLYLPIYEIYNRIQIFYSE